MREEAVGSEKNVVVQAIGYYRAAGYLVWLNVSGNRVLDSQGKIE